MIYHLIFNPSRLDLRLALQDGKVLGHLPNYTRVYKDKPECTDGAMQLLSFRASDDVIHKVTDGGVEMIYVWAGDRGTRSNPQDLVRVEVNHMGAEAGVTRPVQTAKEAFAGLPDDVKLAAIIAHTPGEVLNAIGLNEHSTAILTAWSDNILAGFTAPKG